MNRFDSRSDKILVVFNYIMLTLFAIITFLPFWQLFVMSLSPKAEALKIGLHLYTLNPDFTAYREIFVSPEIWRGIYNSVFRVVLGTAIGVFFTAMTAYPLSKKDFPLNKEITGIIVFTMLFSGGLIPTYIWMNNVLHLRNTIWALVLPGAVGAYNVIITRNFLRSLPVSIQESAKIDGASEFAIWWKIVLPLSKPVLTVIGLWMAVHHWNEFLHALIYITDNKKLVLQVILRRVLLESQTDFIIQYGESISATVKPTAETTKAAIIMVSTLPIAAVYPFLQKYFVKGVMLGSVKG